VGVTSTSIKISVSGVFSGAEGAIGNDIYNNAALVWQKQINANGGIHGRQITLVKVDNQGTADGAIAACKEATGNGSFMVWNMEGAVGAEDDCEDAAGMPVLDANPPYMKPSWQNVIAINVSTGFVPAEVSFLKSHYVNAGADKIGIVYASDKEGYVLWYDAMVRELKAQGLQMVHSEKIVSNQASYVSEMSRMKASGAQLVMLYVEADAPLIIQNAAAIGYQPKWYGGTAEGTVSDTFAQAGGPAYQGLLGTRFWTTTESDAYSRYVGIVRKYNGDAAAAETNGNDVGVYGHADTLGKVFDLAGPDLTRQAFMAAAKSLTGYYNGYLVPFTLANKQPLVGEAAVFPIQCCKSDHTWYTLGPPEERFG
jgi:branched-chain amino acid transport system substrate-binding protein